MAEQQHRSQGMRPPPHPATLRRPISYSNRQALAQAHSREDSGARDGPARCLNVVGAGSGGQGNLKQRKLAIARPISSEDSGETERSDPSKWFDQSNKNPAQSFGTRGMDVDPPYFQKESDSSADELSKNTSANHPFTSHLVSSSLKPAVTTSSEEEYRSVIDDLTVEIKRLKDELRKYKQNVPDALKKDALFEVRVHGLNKRKKRKLENTLRDFATSIGGSAGGSSGGDHQNTNTSSGRVNRNMESSGNGSKYTSSTGNPRRPADSAYASMSNAGHSFNPARTGVSARSLLIAGGYKLSGRTRTTEQKVQSYLDGVPEGLFPRHLVMTEKEKKKLVVRRLEQIFTGKMGGGRNRSGWNDKLQRPPPIPKESSQDHSTMSLPSNVLGPPDAAREARMLTGDGGSQRREGLFRDNGSASGSGDQTESGGITGGSGDNGNGSRCGNGDSGRGDGSSRRGTQSSPTTSAAKYEQRPTHPHDVDPDRIHPPSENMEYFRHLGLAPPSNLSETVFSAQDVAPDGDGWVWLNLICNMAQIHMLNVTPSFIRKAVSERSTMLQISPDRQKIRWRGGTEGTKFTSDSSGDNSKGENPFASASQRKKIKIQCPPESAPEATGPGSSSGRNNLRFASQVYNSSSNTFHYKPMFIHQASTTDQLSDEELSLASLGRGVDSIENSNSCWDYSGAGASSGTGRRRGVEGSMIFYQGAPFYTDLSRDPPVDLTLSPSQDDSLESPGPPLRPGTKRAISGTSLPTRPVLTAKVGRSGACGPSGALVLDLMQVDEQKDDVPSDSDADDGAFPWGDFPEKPQRPRMEKFDAAGLGGVVPEDHFLVHIITQRPRFSNKQQRSMTSRKHVGEDVADTIISRIAEMTAAPLARPSKTPSRNGNLVPIRYLSGQVRRLEPSPLPPPGLFFPPFSSDDEDEDMDSSGFSDDHDESSAALEEADASNREGLFSRPANPQLSDSVSGNSKLSRGNEENEVEAREMDESEADYDASDSSNDFVPDISVAVPRRVCRPGSSAATAGGDMESAANMYDSNASDDGGGDEDMRMD